MVEVLSFIEIIFSVFKKKAASLGSSQPSRAHADGTAPATKVSHCPNTRRPFFSHLQGYHQWVGPTEKANSALHLNYASKNPQTNI
jgi:hypothetical protein